MHGECSYAERHRLLQRRAFSLRPSGIVHELDASGVRELRVADIRRPLARTRTNDAAKVEALMESIQQHGLKVPIDVLEVMGLNPHA